MRRRARRCSSSGAQILAGVRRLDLRDLLRRARRDDRPAARAALRAEVDDPVGGLDHVEVVLDHDHRVAAVDQPVQHLEQQAHVLEVQAGRRLVEDVERAPGVPLGQLGGELHALRLAAGQRRRGLAEVDVAEPDVVQRLELLADARLVLEERRARPRPSCRARRRCSSRGSAPRASRGCSASPCRPRTARRRRAGSASRSSRGRRPGTPRSARPSR